MEEVVNGESWNKKRIAIAIVLLALLIAGGCFLKIYVLDKNSSGIKESVKGVSIEENNSSSGSDSKINIQEVVREKINSLKQEVSGLDVLEIATSSAQVQKILNDIKALEQYPTNQIKEICRKICGL
jgi:hypothetical protein